MTDAQRFLGLLILLTCVAIVLRLVTRRAPLPYPVMLAAAGILVGLLPGLAGHRISSDLILLAFVPGLVFEATITLDLAELRRRLWPVGLLATAGVALTVVCIGALAHLTLRLTWAEGMLLGAILAPTDPIAVVGLVRRLRAPSGLATMLEGESLFNDGTGVAVFAAVLASILGGSPSVGDTVGRFWLITAGGVAVGVAVGLAGALLLRFSSEARLDILVTLAIAYGSYLGADLIHASGIVAVVTAGVTLTSRVGRRLGPRHSTELLDFWGLLAFVLNAILFLVVGTALPTVRVVHTAALVGGAYLIMLAARAVTAYGLLALLDVRGRRIPWRWRHLIFWGGIRGALSVALALSIASGHQVSPTVSVVAYGVVVLSLLIQGGSIRPVAQYLRLTAAGGGSKPDQAPV
ncbi:MAG: cation:proton antiporter [Candidatus Dormibacteraceae bacterium]